MYDDAVECYFNNSSVLYLTITQLNKYRIFVLEKALNLFFLMYRTTFVLHFERTVMF